MKMPNRRCFTCGAPCFGYQCKKCAKKGRWGSLTRRVVHRRYNHRRENNATN